MRYDHPDEHLADDEICYIHLGDARHIAIINMLHEGVDLLTAAMLAGHNNVNTTSHYGANTKKFIECNGDMECIGEALLRVRSSSNSYEAYLTWKKIKEMESHNGKKETDQ